MSLRKSIFILFFCRAFISGAAGDEHTSPLVLPPVIYAVPGETVSVVFRNAALVPPGEVFEFSGVDCQVGAVDAARESWTFTPEGNQTGDHPFTLQSGEHRAQSIIRVVPRDAGVGRKISMLVVGDSLTNASAYPNEIARLLSKPVNPDWKMIGTYRPSNAAENVVHEGYGGWTWNRFNTAWNPDKPQAGKEKSSPFLFLQNSVPGLDFDRYFSERCGGVKPDFATFLLGINDCFHANPEDPAAVEAKIDAMLAEAEKLIAALHAASPGTQVGICLTPPGNDRDGAFVANYKDRYTRWGWRRIQFRLVQKQIAYFGNREVENIFIVPTSVGIDPITGYPNDNGVHPNLAGYRTLGGEIYAWLKWRLSMPSRG